MCFLLSYFSFSFLFLLPLSLSHTHYIHQKHYSFTNNKENCPFFSLSFIFHLLTFGHVLICLLYLCLLSEYREFDVYKITLCVDDIWLNYFLSPPVSIFNRQQQRPNEVKRKSRNLAVFIFILFYVIYIILFLFIMKLRESIYLYEYAWIWYGLCVTLRKALWIVFCS